LYLDDVVVVVESPATRATSGTAGHAGGNRLRSEGIREVRKDLGARGQGEADGLHAARACVRGGAAGVRPRGHPRAADPEGLAEMQAEIRDRKRKVIV
jgi:hypothetical protein